MATLRKTKGSALTFDEMDANFNEAQFRIGSKTINDDFTLGEGQSALFIGDSLSIKTGVTVDLTGDANITVVPLDTIERFSGRYQHGDTVQTVVHRTDVVGKLFPCVATTVSAFGSSEHINAIQDLSIKIRPKFANSIILIEGVIFGEGDHDLGYVMLRDWNPSTDQYGGGAYITDTGFEGYNPKALRLKQAVGGAANENARLGQLGSYNDGSDTNSTPQNTPIMWFGKPNTTNDVVYSIGIISGQANAFMLNSAYGYAGNNINSPNYEHGISFMKATEIFQEE